jgi:hypothetical protein
VVERSGGWSEIVSQGKDRAQRIEKEIGTDVLREMRQQIHTQLASNTAGITTADAWIEHYLLIDFGFASGQPYEPNSIQFYDANGFLCWKFIDSTSIQTVAPILACKYVHVTWDTATNESIHIYGYQPKP